MTTTTIANKIYMGTIKNLQIVLNTPKNSSLNQATEKNTCQKLIFLPKKSRNQKLQTQRNPLIILVT